MADTISPRTSHRRTSFVPISPSAGPAATARLFELHNRLRAGRAVNAVDLSAETEFSARTIKRDIEFLRDRCKAPVVWDAKRKSYATPRSSERGVVEQAQIAFSQLAPGAMPRSLLAANTRIRWNSSLCTSG